MLLVNGSMQIIVEGIDFISSLIVKHEINHKMMMLNYNIDRCDKNVDVSLYNQAYRRFY